MLLEARDAEDQQAAATLSATCNSSTDYRVQHVVGSHFPARQSATLCDQGPERYPLTLKVEQTENTHTQSWAPS